MLANKWRKFGIVYHVNVAFYVAIHPYNSALARSSISRRDKCEILLSFTVEHNGASFLLKYCCSYLPKSVETRHR